jgi:hypothetical protein
VLMVVVNFRRDQHVGGRHADVDLARFESGDCAFTT